MKPEPPPSPPAHARPAPRGGRRLLGLLLLLFALPFTLAAGLYWSSWRPAQRGNYGELLGDSPPLPLSQLHSYSVDSGNAAPALSGRWLLLVASAGDCGAPCRQQLDLAQRLHLALNKNQPRLKRLLLTTQPTAAAALQRRWPDLVVANSADANWQALLAALPAGESRVYLVDPAGRPVLRFPAEVDGRRALRDLDRLLKLSWIG